MLDARSAMLGLFLKFLFLVLGLAVCLNAWGFAIIRLQKWIAGSILCFGCCLFAALLWKYNKAKQWRDEMYESGIRTNFPRYAFSDVWILCVLLCAFHAAHSHASHFLIAHLHLSPDYVDLPEIVVSAVIVGPTGGWLLGHIYCLKVLDEKRDQLADYHFWFPVFKHSTPSIVFTVRRYLSIGTIIALQSTGVLLLASGTWFKLGEDASTTWTVYGAFCLFGLYVDHVLTSKTYFREACRCVWELKNDKPTRCDLMRKFVGIAIKYTLVALGSALTYLTYTDRVYASLDVGYLLVLALFVAQTLLDDHVTEKRTRRIKASIIREIASLAEEGEDETFTARACSKNVCLEVIKQDEYDNAEWSNCILRRRTEA